MKNNPTICLINPYITDFAAHDLWAKPLGLLYIGAFLKKTGYQVKLIDCQSHDFASNLHPFPRRTKYGTGRIKKKKINKPEIISSFQRIYYQYGIAIEDFQNYLVQMLTGNKPDVFIITSQMTYWYPGIRLTIDIIKKYFENTPIILGGIYPTLCPEHAKLSFNDCKIHEGPFNQACLDTIDAITGFDSNFKVPSTLFEFPYPLFESYDKLDSIPILTSLGCPYNCDICASSVLQPRINQKESKVIIDELKYYINKFEVNNFAFYDDALLFTHEKHIIPILEEVIKTGYKLNFHVPNGLQICDIDFNTAIALFNSGFRELRLSFEGFETSSSFTKPLSDKIFTNAVSALKKAGFNNINLRAYIIVGIPNQDIQALIESILFTHSLGVRVELASYSLIPRTKGFHAYNKYTKLPIESEPVLQNNTLWNWRLHERFQWEKHVRSLVKFLNDNHGNDITISRNNSIVNNLIRNCLRND